jgi:hypothetical protein
VFDAPLLRLARTPATNPRRCPTSLCTVAEVRQRFVDDLGAPSWRVTLFDGWDILRRGVAVFVPSARWWLWDCFISDHTEPLFGESETMQAVVILPAAHLPREEHEIAMLVDFIRSAQGRHGVDLTMVLEYPPGHPDNIETMDALEGRWRPRAVLNVADHVTRVRVPAGFVEVQP